MCPGCLRHPVNVMKQIKLEVNSREEVGRGPSRRLRVSGNIPAVIYGKSGCRNLVIDRTVFMALWKQVSGIATLIEVYENDRDAVWSIIKEVQRNPVTDAFLHIDFHEIERGKPMQANISVRLIGDAIGVKTEDGLLEMRAHDVEVRCLPRYLPEVIVIDVSGLHVGQSIHVSEIEALEGVDFLDDPRKLIVACVGRAEEEEPEEVEEEITEEVAEGETPATEEPDDKKADGDEKGKSEKGKSGKEKSWKDKGKSK